LCVEDSRESVSKGSSSFRRPRNLFPSLLADPDSEQETRKVPSQRFFDHLESTSGIHSPSMHGPVVALGHILPPVSSDCLHQQVQHQTFCTRCTFQMLALNAAFVSASRPRRGMLVRRRRGAWWTVLYGSSISSFLYPTTTRALHVALVSGTTRTDGPPRPILGPRVVNFITYTLEDRGHKVSTIDPNEFPLLEKPQFCYSKGQAPLFLEKTHAILNQADAYVCVTPEYNHAPSPALVNVLNHFGSSTFSFKPSAIVSYSAGQWGGTRAAIALRPILSELGCLPVSAMIHIPKAQNVLEENGMPVEDADQWKEYCHRCFSQLEWWGDAAKEHRTKVDPFDQSPSFQTSPSQRNVPQK